MKTEVRCVAVMFMAVLGLICGFVWGLSLEQLLVGILAALAGFLLLLMRSEKGDGEESL